MSPRNPEDGDPTIGFTPKTGARQLSASVDQTGVDPLADWKKGRIEGARLSLEAINQDLENPQRLEQNKLIEPSVPNPEYHRQILDEVNSCFPTSILNGWVHQGILSSEEARQIQNTFTTSNRSRFYDDGDKSFKNSANDFSTLVSNAVNRKVTALGLQLKGLSRDQISQIVLQELHKESVVIGGGESHAVLLIGYGNSGTSLIKRDPLNPNVKQNILTESFVIATIMNRTTGGGVLVIIPKPETAEPNNFTPKGAGKQSFRPKSSSGFTPKNSDKGRFRPKK